MLGYVTHDVRITAEIRETPPQDGWACWEHTGLARITCSCGHAEGPIPTTLTKLVAHQHIHGHA